MKTMGFKGKFWTGYAIVLCALLWSATSRSNKINESVNQHNTLILENAALDTTVGVLIEQATILADTIIKRDSTIATLEVKKKDTLFVNVSAQSDAIDNLRVGNVTDLRDVIQSGIYSDSSQIEVTVVEY